MQALSERPTSGVGARNKAYVSGVGGLSSAMCSANEASGGKSGPKRLGPGPGLRADAPRWALLLMGACSKSLGGGVPASRRQGCSGTFSAKVGQQPMKKQGGCDVGMPVSVIYTASEHTNDSSDTTYCGCIHLVGGL